MLFTHVHTECGVHTCREVVEVVDDVLGRRYWVGIVVEMELGREREGRMRRKLRERIELAGKWGQIFLCKKQKKLSSQKEMREEEKEGKKERNTSSCCLVGAVVDC